MMNDNDEKKKHWKSIQEDLKSALDSWTDLSQKARVRKSPEQQQMEEIRRLLGDLQSKIRSFDEEPEA